MPLIDLVSTFCYITATCITTDMQERRPIAAPLIGTRQTMNIPMRSTLPPVLITSTVSSSAPIAASSELIPLTLNINSIPAQNSLTPVVNSTANGNSKVSNNSKNAVNSKVVPNSKVTFTSKSGSDTRKNIRESSPYPTRYDYIDVETVMNNERIVKALFNCVMEKGPCTREGLELKRIIPDALQTECAKCTDRQRKQAGKVLAHLMHYKPDYWKMLWEKFDPNNVYLKKFLVDEKENAVNNTIRTSRKI
ncbi:uncharacterized protein LOC126906241 [Daktulosphaira vitifoliae]|uniref:Chemosensory protein 1 n=1 Tax=Daktulosphaira vitifoliae TaxID=58002 RepID=A0A1W6R6F7_DAKVI|nr:uncharacterized protein LOC126906241 [Daktulosphaira vitifoliae]ARO50007.1 chemosensory protein 1 [Daktulosphaira vitifoliae]